MPFKENSGWSRHRLQNKAALVSQHRKVRAWTVVCSATCFTSYNESLFTHQESKKSSRRICNTHTQCCVSALKRVFPGRRGGTWYKQDTGNGCVSEKGQSKNPYKIMDTVSLLFIMRSCHNGHSKTVFKNVWYYWLLYMYVLSGGRRSQMLHYK